MPTTLEAVRLFHEKGVLYSPGKASNAGGVACSGLEMVQGSTKLKWTREEVDKRLHQIMGDIHRICIEAADEHGMPGNYVAGANIAAFKRVANAMIDQGNI